MTAPVKSILGLLAVALLAPAIFAAMPSAPKPVVKITPIPPVGPSPITPDCRYLFVVDLSSAMQRAADGLYRTTHRLVASGLGGRMRDGDVFTVWTYADTVLTREFPLNAWTPDLNIALANRTYEFLAQQKFRGKSNLRPVFAELGQALAIATNLTIVLISDGTDVIVGTPFDRPINVTYGKRASEMRAARMPFITSLVTQRGEFTHWSVRGGLEDVSLPFPEPPVAPAPVVAQTPPAVTPAPKPAPPPPVVPPPVVIVPKPASPTNAPPPVVATTPPPKPQPAPPAPTPRPTATAPTNLVTKPVPPVATNTVAVKPREVVVPKPSPAPAPASKPATNAVASVPPTPKKPEANVPLLAPPPKQEAKAAIPPPPKPVVATPKPPAPKPVVTLAPTNPPAPPAPSPIVAKPKEQLVMQPLPPAIPPALRQPKSAVDASNALAKVELLRPPAGTSAPPARPLEARVIESKPAPPKPTNAVAAVAPAIPPRATNAPVVKTATSPPVVATTPARTIPIIVPPPVTPKPVAVATNQPSRTTSRTNLPPPATALVLPKRDGKGGGKPITPAPPAATAPKPAPPGAKAAPPPPPAKPAGQLAVAAPGARRGGWGYLAAAVVLLALAGGIITYLLRPRPHPSVISQSLDDKRV